MKTSQPEYKIGNIVKLCNNNRGLISQVLASSNTGVYIYKFTDLSDQREYICHSHENVIQGLIQPEVNSI